VLCSIEGWPLVLDEMVRVTKPGGKVISTCPDWSTFSSSAMETWVEGLIKLALEYAIKEPFSFTKKSKGHFQDRGLMPVSLTLEQVRSQGYDDVILDGIIYQVERNAHSLLGNDWPAKWLINSSLEHLFGKVKAQTANGSYYDVH